MYSNPSQTFMTGGGIEGYERCKKKPIRPEVRTPVNPRIKETTHKETFFSYGWKSENGGKTPKMDGENNGNPGFKLDDLGGKPPIFGNTHIKTHLKTSKHNKIQPLVLQHFNHNPATLKITYILLYHQYNP